MKHKMTDQAIKAKKTTGLYPDGGNLYLKVSPSGGKSWVFRYRDRTTGKHRYMGIGPYGPNDATLADARDEAAKCRKQLRDSLDPLSERHRLRAEFLAAEGNIPTFSECCEKYIAKMEPGWRNPKHVQQWRNTLNTYAGPVMGELPVNMITSAHVLKVLDPIWQAKTETATRVRGRIQKVLDWAASPTRRYRTGPNPAAWAGNLEHELPKPSKIKNERHHPALPYEDMYKFMTSLKDQSGVAARALEFTILTACRTGEVTAAEWSEFDLDDAEWNIPSEHTKAGKPHRVPLTKAALDILKAQQGQHETYLFPGAREGNHLSTGAMPELLKDMKRTGITVHGFRSSFRDWAGETTNTPREVCEMALAHSLGDKTEAAYARGDLLAKRARLMDKWAKYCNTEPVKGTVTPLHVKAE